MNKILVIHGLNHDKMGKEANSPHPVTMEHLNELMDAKAKDLHLSVTYYQNNDHFAVAERIRTAKNEGYEAIVFQPAKWMFMEEEGHILAAALKEAGIPTLEIHISNIFTANTVQNRIGPAVTCILSGFGNDVYPMALDVLARWF